MHGRLMSVVEQLHSRRGGGARGAGVKRTRAFASNPPPWKCTFRVRVTRERNSSSPLQGGVLRHHTRAHWFGNAAPEQTQGEGAGAQREETRAGPWARNEAAVRAGAKQLNLLIDGGFGSNDGGGQGGAGRGNVAGIPQGLHRSVHFQQDPLPFAHQQHNRILHQRKRQDVDTAYAHSWRAATPVCMCVHIGSATTHVCCCIVFSFLATSNDTTSLVACTQNV
jgi:hypothetical protein